MIQQVSLSEESWKKAKSDIEKTFFYTGLEFLKEHKGLRPGKMHLMIGMPSGGKSTMRNTLIFDFLQLNPKKKIFLWLSEESKKDFEIDLARNIEFQDLFSRIFIFSEADDFRKLRNQEKSIELFEEMIIQSECDLVVFDNLTTSKVYGSKFSENENFCHMLRAMNSRHEVPFFCFAHTSAEIKEGFKGLIDMNHIRGTKTTTNIAQFMYIMQSFRIKEQTNTTLRVVKHRGIPVKNKIFVLPFDEKRVIYRASYKLEFDLFKKLYKKQDSLSAR